MRRPLLTTRRCNGTAVATDTEWIMHPMLLPLWMIAMVSAVPSVILNAKLVVPPLVLLPVSGMAYMATFSLLVLAFGLLTEQEKAVMKRSLYVWNRRSAESR